MTTPKTDEQYVSGYEAHISDPVCPYDAMHVEATHRRALHNDTWRGFPA